MKKFSLKPTKDNALEMLKADSLGRNELLFRFIKLLGKLDDECWTVAVNGDWGSGKTFFVKQAKLILDTLNPQSNLEDNIRNDIQTINYMQALKEKQTSEDIDDSPTNNIVLNNFATVYYDAWLNDNHDDPILSLMYATIASNQSNFSEDKIRNFWNIITALAGVVTKRNFNDFNKALQGNDIFQDFKDDDYVSKKVKEFIDSLIGESNKRLVIFIDELDRCKPDYAIRFLERIKHYFDDDRVIFVFSVNLLQLQYTVKNYYGANFDATRYLDKFFDLRCSLPTIDIEKYIRERLHFSMDTVFEYVCIETAKYFGFTLRECEHYIRLVKIVFKSNNLYDIPSSLLSRKFCIIFILPILIALQIQNMKDYSDCMSGANPHIMINALLNIGSYDLKRMIFSNNELSDNLISSTTIPTMKERLQKIYDAIFLISEYNDKSKKQIADMQFTRETKKYLENILSSLSNFSNYND